MSDERRVSPGQPGEHLDDERRAEYVDGRLQVGERELARQHLELCEACRTSVDQDLAVVALLRQLPSVEPPRSFALPEPVARPVWARATAWTRLASGLAAAMFVVLIGVDLAAPPVPVPASAPAEAEMAAALQQEHAPVPAPAAPIPAPRPAAPAAAPVEEVAPPAAMADEAPSAEKAPPRAMRQAESVAEPLEAAPLAVDLSEGEPASGLRLAQALAAGLAVLFAVVSFILGRRERLV